MGSTMNEGSSTMAEKFSGRALVEAVAGRRLVNDTRDSWIRRAARNAGTSYRQAKAIFYGEITDPYHPAVTRFKEAAGRDDAERLAEQFEGLARALVARDPDFHSPEISALVDAARSLRGLDRARNHGAESGEVARNESNGRNVQGVLVGRRMPSIGPNRPRTA